MLTEHRDFRDEIPVLFKNGFVCSVVKALPQQPLKSIRFLCGVKLGNAKMLGKLNGQSIVELDTHYSFRLLSKGKVCLLCRLDLPCAFIADRDSQTVIIS